MLFNSLEFPIFLVVAFAAYWSLDGRGLRWQNLLVLVSSYFFYGWWDWRFLSLIVISSVVDYWVGLWLGREGQPEGRRRALLLLSLFTNLGLLGFFKYFNFFVESFAELLAALGLNPNVPALQVVLPVGISFYTFQTLSYSIDIYRRKLEPTRDIIAFFAFVSFFPQLVAGPIERATRLLPQFLAPRRFDSASARDGLRQMLWGLFKKVVVADNLAPVVDAAFAGYATASGIDLFLGIFFFAFQIYCDFSGYSDIAIGVGRLFGFDLMRNFAFPYLARDIAEFWRRWHISLSTWFRDYVYIPLGGSRVGTKRRVFNVLVTFSVSGLWHGANWTFVVWGFLNGLYYVPLMLRKKHKRYSEVVAADRAVPHLRELAAVLGTFALTLFAWVFFRSESVAHAAVILFRLCSTSWLVAPSRGAIAMLPIVAVMMSVEYLQRTKQHGLAIEGVARPIRWMVYLLVCSAVAFLGSFSEVEFIYFQF